MNQLWRKFTGHFSHGFLRAIFGSGVTRLGGMAAGFVFFALIAREFGAETMGRYAIAITIMSIAGCFCNLGFSSSLVRFVSADIERKQPEMVQKRLFWVIRVVGVATLLFSIILAFSRDMIAVYVFDDPTLSPFLLIAALALLPYNVNFILSAYHQGCNRIGLSSALRNMVVPLFSCFFFIALSYFTIHETSTILAQASAILISCLFGVALYWKYRGAKFARISILKDEKKRMLAVSFPLLTGGISGMLLGWADTLMLGMLADTEAAGLYATAFRLSVLISLPLYIVGWALIPRIAGAYEAGNKGLQQKLISDSVHLALAGAVLPVLLFIFFGHFVLSLFGPEFVSAYWVLVILSLSELIVVFFGPAYSVMMMTNQEKHYQNIMIGAVILNIILNFFLIQVMGAIGAALATLFTQAFKQILFTFFVHREHGLITIGGFAWVNMRKLEDKTC